MRDESRGTGESEARGAVRSAGRLHGTWLLGGGRCVCRGTLFEEVRYTRTIIAVGPGWVGSLEVSSRLPLAACELIREHVRTAAAGGARC